MAKRAKQNAVAAVAAVAMTDPFIQLRASELALDKKASGPDRNPWPGWDGANTAVKLAHAGLLRDHVPLGPDSVCLYCGKADHQFHVAASLVDGEWTGPEAEHVEDLIAAGNIAGTPEARAFEKEVARVEWDRGVDGNRDMRPEPGQKCPVCGSEDHAQCWPSLGQRDTERAVREWMQASPRSPTAAMRQEKSERRSEVAALARDFGELMASAGLKVVPDTKRGA